MIFSAGAALLFAGCKTTEEVKPVTWKEQSAYLAKVQDPRYYGYNIYDTPGGIDYRGGCRLHRNQIAEILMGPESPLFPAGMLPGKFGKESAWLFDFSASTSWLEFDLATSLGARPVSEGKAQLVKIAGDDTPGCLSIIPTLRLDQLYIENPLVYVRLDNGPLGAPARGIETPMIKGVLGWDILKKLEQVVLDYPGKRMVISTAEVSYEPNPALLAAAVPLVKHAGACVVQGIVDGQKKMIVIDPAGDFEVATDGASAVGTIQLGQDLVISSPTVSVSPGGTRIGARLLQNYTLAVCPQEGLVYFEKPAAEVR